MYSCGVPIRSQRFRHVYRCLSEVAKFCLLRSHAMKPKANRRRLIETDKLQEEKFERKVTLIEKCDNLMMKWLFYSTVFRDCEIASHPSSISISIPFPSCVMLVTHRSCSGVWCVANLPCPFAVCKKKSNAKSSWQTVSLRNPCECFSCCFCLCLCQSHFIVDIPPMELPIVYTRRPTAVRDDNKSRQRDVFLSQRREDPIPSS